MDRSIFLIIFCFVISKSNDFLLENGGGFSFFSLEVVDFSSFLGVDELILFHFVSPLPTNMKWFTPEV